MKSSINEIALFGGVPLFQEPLHVGRPNIGEREAFLKRVNLLLDDRRLTNRGPMVREFEARICDFIGVKHCVAMCNATVALELLTRGLELKGEVLVPSFTFIATAHALQWQEITPVFCDIDPSTYTIDPAKIEQMITPRTTGIIGVHVWGLPCNTEALEKIAARHSLKIVYDAAHAFGVSRQGRMIGNFGEAEVFSFHATKFFNTFEGGAVVTNNDELAKKLRLMKNYGFNGFDSVIYIGTNGKMSEICAAMGLTGLESIQRFIDCNYANYQLYRRLLSGIRGVRLVQFNEMEKNNYQYVILELDNKELGLTRDQMIELLHAEKILARRYFYPGCHKMEPYRSYFPHAGLLLPETEQLTRRVMALPTGQALSLDEIQTICEYIHFLVDNSEAISLRMASGDTASPKR